MDEFSAEDIEDLIDLAECEQPAATLALFLLVRLDVVLMKVWFVFDLSGCGLRYTYADSTLFPEARISFLGRRPLYAIRVRMK